MDIKRHYTSPETPAFDTAEYENRSCKIRNADGSMVFELDNIEVPADWSQLATDILISKYLRKAGLDGDAKTHETSVKQVIGRVVRSIRRAGEKAGGYFDSPEAAETFEQELTWILLHQHGAFNSPVWFNCGLFDEYGITASGGNWHFNTETGELEELENNYEHPQCSACFIQSIEDDLMSIFGLVKNEARIFKYGSGSGTNFSNLRGRQEHLSGGGTSSGLMSFLEVFDRAAGATKSGGTTRRAAKMVCLDADHPEIRDFVEWKTREEFKARALIEQGYESDFNGEAYRTVSGQNSNNSVRLSDEFMRACAEDGEWQTRLRTSGEVCETFPAKDLMKDICEAAWSCADPGVQFNTVINDWHTCPESGPIRASNPCSEYMFVDDSACNLASINLLRYLREDGSFDIEGFKHTIRIFIMAQEILVGFSSYPGKSIALNSHLFRPLGLGYANLGSLLMVSGLPYDSDEGRALAASVTALMTGHAYRVSAEIAADVGAFAEFEKNRQPMLRVMDKHRGALDVVDASLAPEDILGAAREEWDAAYSEGEKNGYRNAQVSVLAPTGTIGFLMDCDTTGVEPDYALVKFKRLAGGGYFKIVNQSVPRALQTLGYNDTQVGEIVRYIIGTQDLSDAPVINSAALREKGLTDTDLQKLDSALPTAFDLRDVFAPHVLGDEVLERLNVPKEKRGQPDFDLLRFLGFQQSDIDKASRVVCGSMLVEGAPHLSKDHYAVFDCANKCGPYGTRFIQPMGHLRIMAAVQPFLSGAISKTINLSEQTAVEQIDGLYRSAWEMGLKAVAIYRDNCKSSQPLNSSGSKRKGAEDAGDDLDGGQLDLFPDIAEHGPRRRRLPQRRGGITVESSVGGHKVFLRTGEYDNGDLGEVFIDMHKEGSSFRSLIMCFAIAVSKGLQYGVPVREFVDTFTFTNFEPRGICDHPNIKMSTSVIDYVFRVLGMEYMGRTDFCQVKPDWAEDADAGFPAGKGTPGAPRQMARNGESSDRDNGGGDDPQRPDLAQLKMEMAGEGESVAKENKVAETSPLDRQLAEAMHDAPFCDVCGHITVRNGACYKCMNCGNSMGCS